MTTPVEPGSVPGDPPQSESADARLARVEQELTVARNEAETYRASLKALQDANALRDRADLIKKVARSAGLDESLAERLRGDDEAALLADAALLAASIKPTPPSSAGSAANGARGSQQPPAFDPQNPPRLSDPKLWN